VEAARKVALGDFVRLTVSHELPQVAVQPRVA
jgi:hypothetical protein